MSNEYWTNFGDRTQAGLWIALQHRELCALSCRRSAHKIRGLDLSLNGCFQEPQLYRLLDRLPFEDIFLPEDYQTIHEIVGSYAISAGLEVDPDLMTQDFLDRLVCAGAHRWGLVIKLTSFACTIAQDASSTSLTRDHFVKWWVNKTKAATIATPFLHSGYETMYRRDHPFIEAIAD